MKFGSAFADHLGGQVRAAEGADVSLKRVVESGLEEGVIVLEDVPDLVGIGIPIFSCGVEVLLDGVEERDVEKGGVEVVAGLKMDVALN